MLTLVFQTWYFNHNYYISWTGVCIISTKTCMMSRSIHSTGNHFGAQIWQKLLYQKTCIQITQTLAHALQNGWGAGFCTTMQLLFIKLYFHAALNLLTALILLSSSRISDKNYLIQWKFETVSATDAPKYSLKSTDAPPFIHWGWVWRISWKKNSVSNLNWGIMYFNFCEYKNLRSRFSAVSL